MAVLTTGSAEYYDDLGIENPLENTSAFDSDSIDLYFENINHFWQAGFTGSFTYDIENGSLVGVHGTVTSYSYYISGVFGTWGATVTGFSLDISYFLPNPPGNPKEAMFAGDDQFIGSLGGGLYQGYAGNDSFNGGAMGFGLRIMDGGTGSDTVTYAGWGGVTASLADSSVNTGAAEGDRYTSIENLIGTSQADNLYGDAIGNTLAGGGGDDLLDGAGGTDLLQGGAGNDTYIVDNLGDIADERIVGAGGIDTVRSSVSFNLGAQSRGLVENITLADGVNINAVGNSLANVLIGGTGANILAGGNGNDTLTGGGGPDIFLLNTPLNSLSNVDRITDMNEAGNDTIWLDDAIFSALTLGALAAAAFKISSTGATELDDRIVYNRSTGELYYDADGLAAGATTRIAILDPGLALTAADFLVV